ncbi:hypothetical protein [Cellulosimicrobium funkei]|uniref:hypothetical protein n=1 Tax=Cellulosimicrobium funkei TaxID=264251 RepID=UPI0036A45300
MAFEPEGDGPSGVLTVRLRASDEDPDRGRVDALHRGPRAAVVERDLELSVGRRGNDGPVRRLPAAAVDVHALPPWSRDGERGADGTGAEDELEVVGDLAPVAAVVERAPKLHSLDTEATDTVADDGHPDGVRTIRTAARRRVAERLDEIDRLALTTDMSGRAIAGELGLGRTSVCARVSAVRSGRTATWTAVVDGVLPAA